MGMKTRVIEQYPPVRAVARLRGGPLAPGIDGVVQFTAAPGGTWVCVNVRGLPPYQPAAEGRPPIGPHGFHIHEYGRCEVGNPAESFAGAGGHWNPTSSRTGTTPVISPCSSPTGAGPRRCDLDL